MHRASDQSSRVFPLINTTNIYLIIRICLNILINTICSVDFYTFHSSIEIWLWLTCKSPCTMDWKHLWSSLRKFLLDIFITCHKTTKINFLMLIYSQTLVYTCTNKLLYLNNEHVKFTQARKMKIAVFLKAREC